MDYFKKKIRSFYLKLNSDYPEGFDHECISEIFEMVRDESFMNIDINLYWLSSNEIQFRLNLLDIDRFPDTSDLALIRCYVFPENVKKALKLVLGDYIDSFSLIFYYFVYCKSEDSYVLPSLATDINRKNYWIHPGFNFFYQLIAEPERPNNEELLRELLGIDIVITCRISILDIPIKKNFRYEISDVTNIGKNNIEETFLKDFYRWIGDANNVGFKEDFLMISITYKTTRDKIKIKKNKKQK